jgi:sugar/nucleoside kinase (ribokinase family)
MKMLDVLNIGILCADLIFADLRGFPEPGKELACEDFFIKPGGSVNTTAALARLGMKSTLISIVGNDILGRTVLEYLVRMGMDTSGFIQDKDYRTCVSAVLSIKNERGFATYFPKVDDEAVLRRIEKLIPSSRHVHADIIDCLRFPIIDLVKKYNLSLSIDTAWDESIKFDDIKPIIENCDIFITNEIESCSITGKSTAEEAMEEIRKYARLSVVKLGSKGSIVDCGGKIMRVPAAEVDEVKDATGAGDLYSAGFIYGYLNGWDVEKTAKFASASGSLAVTFYGGVDESYTLERVKEYVNKVGPVFYE